MPDSTNKLEEFVTQSIYFGESTQRSEAMNAQVWEKYLDLGSKIAVKSGQYIISIGENPGGLYLISKGKVKGNLLTKDGYIKTIFIKEKMTVFGEQFIFHRQPGIYEVIALEDCELYFFPKQQILELMKEDFELTLFICQSQAIQARMLAYQIYDLSKRNILQSMARILYSVYCYEKTKDSREKPLSINMTHELLANMLGAHRVTVTKNINHVKKLGIIDYKYEKIWILDPERLKKMAEEEL